MIIASLLAESFKWATFSVCALHIQLPRVSLRRLKNFKRAQPKYFQKALRFQRHSLSPCREDSSFSKNIDSSNPQRLYSTRLYVENQNRDTGVFPRCQHFERNSISRAFRSKTVQPVAVIFEKWEKHSKTMKKQWCKRWNGTVLLCEEIFMNLPKQSKKSNKRHPFILSTYLLNLI